MAYIADATKPDPGSIVRVEKPRSSSGKPTYPHFFIVLSAPEPISVGTMSYACVDFTHMLDVYHGKVFPFEVAAEDRGKFIRSDKLQTVVATINAWMRQGRS